MVVNAVTAPFDRSVFDWDAPVLLEPSHQAELDASAIHRGLQALNFYSLDGRDPYSHLLYADDLPRRNDGRLTDYWLHLYTHLDAGGWWCSGLDPLDDWSPMTWGCFKPNRPRTDGTERLKPIKYEHPPRVATRVFCLSVPVAVWRLVSIRHGLPLPPQASGCVQPDPSQFWRWVCQQQLPLILCEGAKKAASLLSHGYVAVGLPGIFGGVRSCRDEAGRVEQRFLIPELQYFAAQGLPFHICFDYETKPHVLANLRCSIRLLSRLLLQQQCEVSLVRLPGPDKGVDDFLTHRAPAAFAGCYRRSESLVLTRFANGLSLVKALPRLEQSLSTVAYRQLLALTRTGHTTGAAQRVLHTLGLLPETIASLQPALSVRLLDYLLSHRSLKALSDD